MQKDTEYTNSLINEKSPYLLQHAHNAVKWFPWSEDIFDKAVREDKPVFLSIGYSTCHWCHVMEKESFNDPVVGELLNENFIPLKVDREERPDIDSVYMTVSQIMTGSGGWPLTVFLTPDKKPFFSATYIPKNSKYGRPGLIDLLRQVKGIWHNQREKIIDSSESVHEALSSLPDKGEEKTITTALFDKGYNLFANSYDSKYGGFGKSPKFPAPHNLLFLLRYYDRTKKTAALEMVEKTLTEMAKGGMYDHIGGGFFRYSTDRHWFLPHFEKMLYDQAMLAIIYTEAYTLTSKDSYKETAVQVLDYMRTILLSPEGAFYTAEDADSEGEEGKFYLFTADEVNRIVGKGARIFNEYYSVTQEGNYYDEINLRETGKNILYVSKTIKEVAEKVGTTESIVKETLDHSRTKIFLEREKRVRPFLDDKILTDWNGLAIGAFAKAAFVFNDKSYLEIAQKAADFFIDNDRGSLLHRYREKEWAIEGFLNDYSFLSWGLLALFEASGDTRYLNKAIDYTAYLEKHFLDQKEGGYYFSSRKGEKILIWKKEYYDGAIPSGNSMALYNLGTLSKITGDAGYEKQAGLVVKGIPGSHFKNPFSCSFLLGALDCISRDGQELVLVTPSISTKTGEILEVIRSTYLPNRVITVISPETRAFYDKLAPFTRKMKPVDNRDTLYVCSHFTCSAPLSSLSEIKRYFSKAASGS